MGVFGGCPRDRIVKSSLLIWLAVELAVASAISVSTCILRLDEVRARRAWRDNPTSETGAELQRQKRITFRHRIVFAGVLFAGMAAITIPVIATASRRKSSGFENQKENATSL